MDILFIFKEHTICGLLKHWLALNQDNGMYMQEYTPTLEIQVKSNKGQCGILIFVEAFRWTLKLHLYIYICLWMVKALYRLFFQYNVNVLGFQNMLHVYDVKRFFLLCSAIRGCLKNSIGKWRYSVKQLERWKFYNKRNMHMCCAIVLCENVQYFMCMISYVKCKVWSISCSLWNLEAARFHFSFIFYWRHLN